MPDTPLRAHPQIPLAELEDRAAFRRRHIGPDADDESAMLALLGYKSRAALIDAVVPASIRHKTPMDVGAPCTEGVEISRLRAVAKHNLMCGPDPASLDRATFGGMIGNNSTGMHSIRYGLTSRLTRIPRLQDSFTTLRLGC